MRFRPLALLVTLALGILAAPLAGEAQQAGKVYRIGILGNIPPTTPELARISEAFLEALRRHGWVEGQNLVIERRYGEGKAERFSDLAAELVRLNVDLVVATAPPATRAAQQATSTIPIVMVFVADPVGMGFVRSLGRPGGNITGPASNVPEGFAGKLLELLKEIVPRASRVGLLFNAGNPLNYVDANAARLLAAAGTLKVRLHHLAIRSGGDLEGAFEAAARDRVEALLVLGDPLTFALRVRIHELAAQHKLPAIFPTKEYLAGRGLISYGPSLAELFVVAAEYVHKILKGAKPADLPVEQPRKYELVVNLKTAKALGLTIPPSVLIRADHVIQ